MYRDNDASELARHFPRFTSVVCVVKRKLKRKTGRKGAIFNCFLLFVGVVTYFMIPKSLAWQAN
jgi:hypothetical protein